MGNDIAALPDTECGVGELVRRRDLALREYMRLDELLYFTMKNKIHAVREYHLTCQLQSDNPRCALT